MAEGTCSNCGAYSKRWVRTWCNACYQRWYKYGDPNGRGSTFTRPPGMSDEDWFLSLADRSGDCWTWMGRRMEGKWDYGMFRRGPAHVWAYRHWVGPIPDGLQVRHYVCDNPPCVNPAHLLLGTHCDNMQDMVDRGRQPRGGRVHTAKLTEDEVREIRASSATNRELAATFGVDKSVISRVRSGKTWRHIL